MSHTPAPNAQLWQTLRTYIEQACAAFGLPSALARMIWITRTQHKHLCQWLRPLEALLRQLIFLDAMARVGQTPPTPQPETKARAKRGMPVSCGAPFDPDNSDAWRTRFNVARAMDRRGVIPGREGANPEARRPAQTEPSTPPPINGVSSAPIALRLEALIRAYNSRDALAEALARKLERDAAIVPQFIRAPRKRDAAAPLWRPVIDAINVARDLFRTPSEPLTDTS